MNPRVLIIGCTSSIARQFQSTHSESFDFYLTSRHASANSKCFTLDLSRYISLPENLEQLNFDYAVFFASVTDMSLAESDPQSTRHTNLISSINVVRDLNRLGIRCLFLSSTAVFSILATETTEYSPKSPANNYGLFKSLVEDEILKSSMNTVLRLTKIIDTSNPLLLHWKQCLAHGYPIEAFSNMRLSPISMSICCQTIASLLTPSHSGIYHLSADSDLSYVDLAFILSDYLNADCSLIKSIHAPSVGYYLPTMAFLQSTRPESVTISLDYSIKNIISNLL